MGRGRQQQKYDSETDGQNPEHHGAGWLGRELSKAPFLTPSVGAGRECVRQQIPRVNSHLSMRGARGIPLSRRKANRATAARDCWKSDLSDPVPRLMRIVALRAHAGYRMRKSVWSSSVWAKATFSQQATSSTTLNLQADLRLQLAQCKVDLTYGVEARRQQSVSGSGNLPGVFVCAPLPVFNRDQGEILRAEREDTQNTPRATALDPSIRTEMLNVWQQYSDSKALMDELEKGMLPRAREGWQTTAYPYRRGEASLVEFLDAQRAFNDSMQTYNEARASLARSLYQIESVTATNTVPTQGGSN